MAAHAGRRDHEAGGEAGGTRVAVEPDRSLRPAPADAPATGHETGAQASAGPRVLAALSYPNYRRLWLGSMATSIGHWMQQVALGWVALTLTNSAAWVGAVGFARGIPMLLFSLVGGVLADRMDRRQLLLIMQAATGTLAGLLALALWTNTVTIELILIFSFLTGSTMSMIFPTRQALVPSLVERKDLANAVAVNSAMMNGSRIVGPSLAGILLGTVGAVGCFVLQAAGFVWALFMTLAMRLPAREAPPRHQTPVQSLLEGFAYIRGNPEILALLGLAAIPTVFGMPYIQMLPVMARDVLGTGPEGLGILMAASGGGALSGSLVIAFLGTVRRKGICLLAAATAFGLFLCLFATARSLPVAMVLVALAGVAQAVYMALNNTLLQTIVPDQFRGRVMSVYMLTWGLMPLGTLPIGMIASIYGTPAAVMLGGGICATFSLLTALGRPVLRRLE
jgi:MFS family permease